MKLWRLLAVAGALVESSCVFTGCSSIPPVELNQPDESETQRKLEHDPRFRDLIEQISAPKKLSWNIGVSRQHDRRGQAIGVTALLTVKGPW